MPSKKNHNPIKLIGKTTEDPNSAKMKDANRRYIKIFTQKSHFQKRATFGKSKS